MNMSEQELDQGIAECVNCQSGIKMLQAGFDIDTYVCSVCREEIADKDDSYMAGARMMSK